MKVHAASDRDRMADVQALDRFGSLLLKHNKELEEVFQLLSTSYMKIFHALGRMALIFIMPTLYAAWDDVSKDSNKAAMYFSDSNVDGKRQAQEIAVKWRLVLRSVNEKIVDGIKKLRKQEKSDGLCEGTRMEKMYCTFF